MDRMPPGERRSQILERARTLFSARPYSEVSNTEIAATLGISRGLLNHYFGTKRDLYLAAVAEMLSVPPIPLPEYVEGASIRDRACASVAGWLELLARNRETWLTAIGIAGTDPELERIIDDARERLVDHIIEVVGLGPMSRRHPEIRAMLRGFSGLAESTSREWLKHERLTKHQVHVFLEEALVKIISEVIPEVVEGSPSHDHA